MTQDQFETLVAQEFERAIPEKFRPHIKNVAFLVEWEPSQEVRTREHLAPNETLLGYYHGIPTPKRGGFYGMGATMPDTITLYQGPIEEEAMHTGRLIGQVIRETIWHEVAHHFGMDEHEVRAREDERDLLQ